ncbi:MAG: hypothetical protein NDJ92_17790, partial [Thermoanaerobaculia bacterium]|nr:hypothetical protein [Thermoanaerobaculia bacterium]
RRSGSVAATAMIGLLFAFLALPLCAAAFTCTMKCCEHSSGPMDDHGAMPAPACGAECSVRAVPPANAEVLVSPEVAHALPADKPRQLFEITTSPSVCRALSQPCASTRPLYVVNDAFLI